MRVVDLFCGIGSFHQATLLVGGEVVLACDIDPAARRVYAANYGLEPQGDVLALRDVPDHDVLCFGSPCQPFSRIGKRRGLDDATRGPLEAVLAVVEDKRPRVVVAENVPGFASAGLDWLASRLEALGYEVQSRVLRCWEHGIPQNRARLFVVATRGPRVAWPEPVATPGLTDYLRARSPGFPELARERAMTVRCGGRRSPVGSRHCWDAYETLDGHWVRLTADDAQHLQGFPADFAWAGVKAGDRWRMLGNTIPVCLSARVLRAVRDSLA